MSRYDIVLLACGSRSMRRVRFFRSANAAARLIAVVVLPTPPFWLAIEMTINSLLDYDYGRGAKQRHCRNGLGACQEIRTTSCSPGRPDPSFRATAGAVPGPPGRSKPPRIWPV